jgi:ABC-type branched-subunit amino acid transport system substrate-binding protein
VAALALAASLAVMAGTSSAAANKQSPYRVLAILPTSGRLGFVGLLEAHAIAAAAHVINKQGGILKHLVELKVVDDGGDGNKAVSVLQQELASGTKYNLIIGGAFGSDAVPLAAALASNPALQIPMAAETVLNDPKKYPNLFIPGAGFSANANGVMVQLKKDNITKIAIVGGDNPTGHNGADALEASAKSAGITVTANVFVPATSVDATPQLQQAQSSGPQALVISGFTPANPAIIKSRTKLGWNVPVYMDGFAAAINMGPFTTTADRKGIKLEVFPFFVKGDASQTAPAFAAFLKNVYRYDPHPALSVYASMVAYDGLMLARGAAIKAKSIEGPAVSKAMNTITDSSQAPGFVGGKKLYTSTNHFWGTAGSDFHFVQAGPLVDGLVVPDAG